MSDYHVKLDVFAGPLDLLLYLIRKDEVDIYDISISKITEQYISYIEILQNFDIDLAGDFLVMAATLTQIKSAMLLPSAESEEEAATADDPRSELIKQLLEYKKIKDAANLLSATAETHEQRLNRPNTIIESLKPNTEPELDMDQISVWDLLEAFDTILKATGSYDDYSRIIDETPIDLYQIDILDWLQKDGPMRFARVFANSKSRLAIVGKFLALLELIRNKLIIAEQDEDGKEIYLKAITDEPAEQAVSNAIMSDIKEEHTPISTPTQEDVPQSHQPTEQRIPIVEIPQKTNTAASPINLPVENL